MTNSFSRLDFPFSCDKISDLTNLFFFAFSASSSSRPLWGTGAGGDSKERQWCLLGWRCRWSCCGDSERQTTSEQQGNFALSESSQWCRRCCWASRRSRGWTGDHLWPKAESVHHTPHCTTSASAARITSGAATAQLRCSRIASTCRTVAGAKPGGKSVGGGSGRGGWNAEGGCISSRNFDSLRSQKRDHDYTILFTMQDVKLQQQHE